MAIRFPSAIYVAQEEETDGTKYLIMAEKPSDLSYTDDVRDVALYRLVRRVKLVNKTEVKEQE